MRRSLFSLATLVLFAPNLHAQILSVYGTFSPLHASNVATGVVASTGGNSQEPSTSFFTPAFGGGATLGLVSLGPVYLGFDVRGSTHRGTTGADLALGGVKLAFKPPFLRIKPYVQGSAGYLATRTPPASGQLSGGTFRNQYFAYEAIAGLDYRLGHFVEFRVLEVGAGQGIDVSDSSNTNGNATLLTLNTGLVVHF